MSLLVPFVLAFLLVSGWLYVRFNDRRLSSIPARALAVSRERVTPELAERVAKELVEAPMSALSHMPPKTGRRYIVVGGVSCSFLRYSIRGCAIIIISCRPRVHVLNIGPIHRLAFWVAGS
jgi:hypothetical protein